MSENPDDQLALLIVWRFWSACLIFFLLVLRGLVEAGTVRRKNQDQTLFNHLLQICVAVFGFYSVGNALALCDHNQSCKVAGHDNFFLLNQQLTPGYIDFFVKLLQAATAATVLCAPVAERCHLFVLCVSTFVIAAVAHPLVVRWFGHGGWLHELGALDFGNCLAMHVVGGCSGLIGTVVIGPRLGRFQGTRWNMKVTPFRRNSPVFQVLGMFAIWVGFYGLNLGHLDPAIHYATIQIVVMNTTITPATAALTLTLIHASQGKLLTEHLTNVCIAGLVASASSCAYIHPWGAVIVGFGAAWVYVFSVHALRLLGIDDVGDAVAAHLCCGVWGVLAVGLLSADELIQLVEPEAKHTSGVVYGSGQLLWRQCVAVLAVLGMTTLTVAPIFALSSVFGLARISNQTEVYGVDRAQYCGAAMVDQMLQSPPMLAAHMVDDSPHHVTPDSPDLAMQGRSSTGIEMTMVDQAGQMPQGDSDDVAVS